MSKPEIKKIIDKIKNGHVKPISRFKLAWKSYAFWALWSSLMLLGSLFVSLVIFNFIDFHPTFLRYMKIGRIFHWLVITAPIFWLLLSLGALVFGLLAFRKTKRGYRYSLLFVTSLTILVVSILGVSFHFLKINDLFREGLFEKSPQFRKMVFPIEGRWQKPGDGFLAGEIGELNENDFKLETPQGEMWTVFYSPNTKGTEAEFFCNNSQIGVIGERRGDYKFEAEIVGPFPKREFEFEKKRMPKKIKPFMEHRLEIED